MSKKSIGSVWDAIEGTPAMAHNMKLRSELMTALAQHIKERGLSQAEAAEVLGVTQARVSDLMRGKISLFGLDTLIKLAAAAGLIVEMKLKKAA